MITSFLAALAIARTSFLSSSYTKSTTTDKGIVQLSTAAQQLKREGKPDIWLVGAIHIGTKPYYDGLQTLLDSNSLVIFEGVKPGEAKPEPAKKPDEKPQEPKTPVYKVLSDALGLQFQLLAMDYKKPFWKNCDLSWDEMEKLNAQSKTKSGQFDQIKQLLDPNSPMAAMFTQMLQTATPGTKEGIKLLLVKKAGAGEGTGLDPATEEIILKARNHTVIDRIEFELSAPTPLKSIAIFYGAAHLDDLEKTLTTKYGYKLGDKKWFLAADADPSKLDQTGKIIAAAADKKPVKAGGGG